MALGKLPRNSNETLENILVVLNFVAKNTVIRWGSEAKEAKMRKSREGKTSRHRRQQGLVVLPELRWIRQVR